MASNLGFLEAPSFRRTCESENHENPQEREREREICSFFLSSVLVVKESSSELFTISLRERRDLARDERAESARGWRGAQFKSRVVLLRRKVREALSRDATGPCGPTRFSSAWEYEYFVPFALISFFLNKC